jgi:hypothetical protein
MHRTTLIVAAAAVLSLVAAACGSDSESTYQATRPASDGPTRTIAPNTSPRTTEPDTPGTIVLPTFPDTPTTEEGPATTLPASGDITVTGTWFADDGYGGYDWGVVYDNSSSSAFEYVPVQAVFLDANGTQLASSESTIYYAAPGTGATTDYTYDLDTAPASMEVTIGDADVATATPPAGTLTPGALTDDTANQVISGQLTSTYAVDVTDVRVVGLWRDAAGAIVRMVGTRLNAAQANGITWFTLPATDGTIGTGVPTEVYVSAPPESYVPDAPSAELAIQESWYHSDGSGGITWGAILANSGTTTWDGPLVLAKFYDAENRLVDASSSYFSEVRPGTNAALGSVYALPAAPVRMEVALTDGGYEDDSPDAGGLTIDQVTYTPEPDSTYGTVTGSITSTFADEQAFVSLVIVWRDASNAVVYSTSAYSDTVPANGTQTFETTVSGDNLPATQPTEVYWTI